MQNANMQNSSDEYSKWVGFIFIFNLIVGTGTLTLPAVFAKAGWMLSVLVIALVCAISYMTVTFVIEAQAGANAILQWQRLQYLKQNFENQADYDEDNDVTDRLLEHQDSSDSLNALEEIPVSTQQSIYYSLDKKVEMGEMAGLFFNEAGRILFYICIVVYLYGDLSIYSAAVAKSLRDVVCDRNGTDMRNVTLCWSNHTITRLDIYRIFLIFFITFLGPFAIFSVQKTKYIQMLTVIFRWFAFSAMILISINLLIRNGPSGHPSVANFTALPSLFGACVYSFMCHHSLPSLLAPLANKRSINSLISFDYSLICTFYIVLSMTGIFAFAHIEDLYTLNFVPSTNDESHISLLLRAIDYFLALFPVFTLSASFPIIAITLRNNLQSLFLDISRIESYNFFIRRLLFPIVAILPPVTIAYFTENLTSLVGFTGCYAGAGIQYLIPISLVYNSRRTCTDLLGRGVVNNYHSPFRSVFWLLLVLIWAVACMILITADILFLK